MRKMTERQRENLQLAHILDLDDCDPRNFKRFTINGKKWIGSDGAPEWCRNRDSPWFSWDGEYITVYDLAGGFMPFPDKEAHGKTLVYTFLASERECPWCGPGTDNEDDRDNCDLCEGNGHIYHGEIGCYVYRLNRSV